MNPMITSRLKLLLLAGLFFGPFIMAWVVYFGPDDWKPGGNTAVGHLVSPARPMPAGLSFVLPDGQQDTLREYWTVLHIGSGACAEDCRHRLWQTRQMRTLLHRNRGRVQRAYLSDVPGEVPQLWSSLQAEHPRLKVLSLPAEQAGLLRQWLGSLDVVDPVIVVDPLGNFLMYYGGELPLKGMYKDIKRLLKLSNIG